MRIAELDVTEGIVLAARAAMAAVVFVHAWAGLAVVVLAAPAVVHAAIVPTAKADSEAGAVREVSGDVPKGTGAVEGRAGMQVRAMTVRRSSCPIWKSRSCPKNGVWSRWLARLS